jgi:FK506-binding nuclear protein
MKYVGRLKSNGKVFDASKGAPFTFRLGVGEVIKGWDIGVKGMRVGDKRKLIIPPDMAYGKKGAPGAIPPNAWLEFDIVRAAHALLHAAPARCALFAKVLIACCAFPSLLLCAAQELVNVVG